MVSLHILYGMVPPILANTKDEKKNKLQKYYIIFAQYLITPKTYISFSSIVNLIP